MDICVKVLNEGVPTPDDVLEAAGGDALTARIFYNRGYRNPEVIRQMLDDSLYRPTSHWEFPDMRKAVDRLSKAASAGEHVAVYGDYDVDGVTSTVVLVECFKKLGLPVEYHVPDRFTEGYGMNEGVIRDFAVRGVKLIVTCDCGISNVNEIKTAKELGMDVIITDHHNIPDSLPQADAVLNPKLLEEGHRARNISGCAMAYFLTTALFESFAIEGYAHRSLDLLAMSLIADVVSLNGENRYLLKKALPELYNTKRPGLKALFEVIGRDARLDNEEAIAFQLAPRINAAGRMESARLPVELLLGSDGGNLPGLAQKIDYLNRERKRLQEEIVRQAKEIVENKKKNRTVLVLYNQFWHHGILGIAAGKICEAYGKPAVLLSLKEDGETVVGSARSIEGIDIYALLKECSGMLQKFGGHTMAAGLSLKKQDVDAFTARLEELAEEKHFIKDRIQVNVDMELDVGQVNEELYKTIERAGPFGEGFEAPAFVARGVSIVSDRKTEKNHHIMVLAGENDSRLSAVKWSGGNEDLCGKVFDIVYKLGRNTYRGRDELQLTLDYVIPCGGRSISPFKGEIIDGRGRDIKGILKDYPKALVYYEGLKSLCPVDECFDRRGTGKCSCMVFVSTPVNTEVFRELISLSAPSTVILNFSVLPDYSFRGFTTSLAGMVKRAAEQGSGRISLSHLAVRLCVEESIVRAGLLFLKSIGKIAFSLDEEGDSLLVCLTNDPKSAEACSYERNLKNALQEKQAYMQFLLKLDAGLFREYLK